MTVTVLFLGPARDAVGMESARMELPDGATLSTLKLNLEAQHTHFRRLFDSARFAVNEEFAADPTAIRAGDIIAVIPPVSGG